MIPAISSVKTLFKASKSTVPFAVEPTSTTSKPQTRYSQTDNDFGKISNKKTESRNRLPEFKLGDTVKAPNGYGQIVEIDNDQYLIAMENQIAKIWERRDSLIKVEKLPPYSGHR